MHPTSHVKPTPGRLVLAAAIAALALILSGCAGNGTRYIESLGIEGSGTQSPAGDATYSGGVKVEFRDARDIKGKTKKKLSLREDVVELLDPPGAPFPLVVTRFPEEAAR